MPPPEDLGGERLDPGLRQRRMTAPEPGQERLAGQLPELERLLEALLRRHAAKDLGRDPPARLLLEPQGHSRSLSCSSIVRICASYSASCSRAFWTTSA